MFLWKNGDWDAYFDGSHTKVNYNPADSRIRLDRALT